jgi:hypothetical protein
MKLVKEVANNPHVDKRYLLLEGVTDMDAIILELCNMVRVPELDENDPEKGIHNYEAWQPIS